MATNRARISSPRSVRMIHRDAAASHSSSVTVVENSALRSRPNVRAMRRQCSKISRALTYFADGMWPVSSNNGR